LKTLGLIDKVVSEPLGGAHRDHSAMIQTLKKNLEDALSSVVDTSPSKLIERRLERIMSYGKFRTSK